MSVPIYLGICRMIETDVGHAAAADLMTGNAGIAVVVALAHAGVMTLSGGALAYGVYRWFGLQFLSKGWFNLDVVWALSLIGVGAISLSFIHRAERPLVDRKGHASGSANGPCADRLQDRLNVRRLITLHDDKSPRFRLTATIEIHLVAHGSGGL
ncbi:MAG: hypothetical protein AAF376_00390 [Pseudomonadota bacterium]